MTQVDGVSALDLAFEGGNISAMVAMSTSEIQVHVPWYRKAAVSSALSFQVPCSTDEFPVICIDELSLRSKWSVLFLLSFDPILGESLQKLTGWYDTSQD